MLTQRDVDKHSDFYTSNAIFRIASRDKNILTPAKRMIKDCDINTSKYVDFKREEHHNVQRDDIMMTLCHEQVIHDQSY
jgi:hypothetical protein